MKKNSEMWLGNLVYVHYDTNVEDLVTVNKVLTITLEQNLLKVSILNLRLVLKRYYRKRFTGHIRKTLFDIKLKKVRSIWKTKYNLYFQFFSEEWFLCC